MGSAEVQGPLWGASANDWAEIVEPDQIPYYEAALDAIEVRPDEAARCGMRFRLGDGTGPQARRHSVRHRCGRGSSRGRAKAAAWRDLRHGDVEALPYEDQTFDAVTAFNSVQYATDPTAALREVKRVSRSGAPVAIATWGQVEQCEMRVVLGAIGSLLPPPPPGAGGPFALAAPGALEALVEGAGLNAEQVIDVPTPFISADLDTAIRGHLSSGPARMAIDRAGVAATRAALVDALDTFTQSDGSIQLDNVFKVVIART